MLRGMLVVMMVAAIAGALGLFGTAPVAAQGSPSATRSFSPDTVAPGGRVEVTITVANYDSGGSVAETLPQGFNYVSSNLDQADVTGQKVEFTLPRETTSFTYIVTAPSEAGSYTFSGNLKYSGGNDPAVGGASTVTVTAGAAGDPLVVRYDANKNGTIEKSEIIAAINDYLFGGATPITKADVIKLINLYLFGPAAAQPPGAPTNLTATANGQTRIDLSWRAPANNGGAAITGYRVEVLTDGSSWSTLAANTNSTAARYSHTGLTAGSARRYRVSAINSAGTGPASNAAAAATDSASGGASPDLVVQSPTVSDSRPGEGASFTLRATVLNRGSGASAPARLVYYRSTDSTISTISTSDTQVGTDEVGGLAASGTSNESIDLTAPSSAGTYYYGACVDPVSGESDTGNNCSVAVAVTVVERPDLVVRDVSVSNPSPDAVEVFKLNATVRNRGSGASAPARLVYYRSTDSTISTSDTQVGTAPVGGLAASGTSNESIGLTAPSSAGTYYYGACVDPLSGESNTGNNCSGAVAVTVVERPDLVVRDVSVTNRSPDAGAPFTLSATVRNLGSGASGPTRLVYYRSIDPDISTIDTQVGNSRVKTVPVSGYDSFSIDLDAPRDANTYYYGACVEPVSDESDTGNNCSDEVKVNVR